MPASGNNIQWPHRLVVRGAEVGVSFLPQAAESSASTASPTDHLGVSVSCHTLGCGGKRQEQVTGEVIQTIFKHHSLNLPPAAVPEAWLRAEERAS